MQRAEYSDLLRWGRKPNEVWQKTAEKQKHLQKGQAKAKKAEADAPIDGSGSNHSSGRGVGPAGGKRAQGKNHFGHGRRGKGHIRGTEIHGGNYGELTEKFTEKFTKEVEDK
ncbi:hypothetical protein SDC9_207577 [bioreactor metagenome]|uniref:Uncharacterized protein n=1 Tax=bioreactor metagenome TaxID=1076179 RepID=A0A645J823_9ZZZZ